MRSYIKRKKIPSGTIKNKKCEMKYCKREAERIVTFGTERNYYCMNHGELVLAVFQGKLKKRDSWHLRGLDANRTAKENHGFPFEQDTE